MEPALLLDLEVHTGPHWPALLQLHERPKVGYRIFGGCAARVRGCTCCRAVPVFAILVDLTLEWRRWASHMY